MSILARSVRSVVRGGQGPARYQEEHMAHYLLSVHSVAGELREPMTNGEVLTTDGPFVESKEHLGGFYIIQADNLDAALAWATKVTKTIQRPIEVWPFVDVRS